MPFADILAALNAGQLVHEQSTEMTVGNKTILTAVLAPESVLPTPINFTIGITGNILLAEFSEPVVGHNGLTLTASGGPVDLVYDSGEGTTVLLFVTTRVIGSGETVTVSYSTSDMQDLVGNPLTVFADNPVG